MYKNFTLPRSKLVTPQVVHRTLPAAFTLVELLVVIAIVAMLIAILGLVPVGAGWVIGSVKAAR